MRDWSWKVVCAAPFTAICLLDAHAAAAGDKLRRVLSSDAERLHLHGFCQRAAALRRSLSNPLTTSRPQAVRSPFLNRIGVSSASVIRPSDFSRSV